MDVRWNSGGLWDGQMGYPQVSIDGDMALLSQKITRRPIAHAVNGGDVDLGETIGPRSAKVWVRRVENLKRPCEWP